MRSIEIISPGSTESDGRLAGVLGWGWGWVIPLFAFPGRVFTYITSTYNTIQIQKLERGVRNRLRDCIRMERERFLRTLCVGLIFI